MKFKPNISSGLLTSNITNDLKSFIEDAEQVNGIVAYWTINERSVLFQPLIAKLSRPDSFLCVDISFPTDLNSLLKMAEKGANIFLFIRRRHTIQNKRLLHTKAWLFQGQTTSKLLVGSHNFTSSALKGDNYELSTIEDLDHFNLEQSFQKDDFLNYCKGIKNECISFNPNDIELYKILQEEPKVGSDVQLIIIIVDQLTDLNHGDALYVLNPNSGIREFFFYMVDRHGNNKSFRGRNKIQGIVDYTKPETYEVDFQKSRNYILNINKPFRVLNTANRSLDEHYLRGLQSYQLTILEEIRSTFVSPHALGQLWPYNRNENLEVANLDSARAHAFIHENVKKEDIESIKNNFKPLENIEKANLNVKLDELKEQDKTLLEKIAELSRSGEEISLESKELILKEIEQDELEYEKDFGDLSARKKVKSPVKAIMVPGKKHQWS